MSAAFEVCRKYGMSLGYHNHYDEFLTLEDGKMRLETLFENCDEGVTFQPDVCWIAYAGCDPCAWIEKYANRLNSVHLKQLGTVDGNKQCVPFRNGVLDLKKIIELAESHGNHLFIVEQERTPGDVMEVVAENLSILQTY